MWVRTLSLVALAVAVVAAALLFTPLGERPLAALFAVGDAESIDFRTLTPADSPNWYLICPPAACTADGAAESPIFEGSVERLRARWHALAATRPRVERLAEHPDGWQSDYLQRSARFRFPDLITVRFFPVSPEQSTRAVYSRALYGRRDFDVNRARIETWLAGLLQ